MKNNINEYFENLKTCIDNLDRIEVERFINLLTQARDNENNIFIMGNGGSGSTASHFACDFNKGLSYNQDKKFKIICLNDNISTILAYSNDINYEDIFVEQLKNFLKKDDLVVGISTSGNSKNVIKAIDYANNAGAITVGLTGYNGGLLKEIAQFSVNTNTNNVQISEDTHIAICHLAYDCIMKTLTL